MAAPTNTISAATRPRSGANCAPSDSPPCAGFTAGEVEGFLRQVTTDFEELTWLRGLATHLEICEVHTDVTDVAASVLPDLRRLIGAESLILLSPRAPTAGSLVAYETGNSPVTHGDLKRVMAEFGGACQAQPVVRNLGFGTGIAKGGGDLRNLILTRVGQGKHQFGWLLALNKVRNVRPPDEQRTVDAQSYSESEFGTFEAGMVNAAAVLLGSHARNVDMFHEQEQLFRGLVKALINSIDAKDPYTCGHSDRVAQMARRLAREVKLSPIECEQIYMTGLLHDIGKIGVPDEILQKPGKLTDEEFALIKKHPEIGCSIVEHLTQLHYALPGIRHHHESYDGTGYPDGLAGDEIPYVGRLLAVVDAYDAMTSDRPYRAGMPTERAEQILCDGAGQQWDPQLVAAFFQALPEMKTICGFAGGGGRKPQRSFTTAFMVDNSDLGPSLAELVPY